MMKVNQTLMEMGSLRSLGIPLTPLSSRFLKRGLPLKPSWNSPLLASKPLPLCIPLPISPLPLNGSLWPSCR